MALADARFARHGMSKGSTSCPPGHGSRSYCLAQRPVSRGSDTGLIVILSEASLRAKSKDPHLVASNAWVADPSQANVILSEASLRAKSKDPHLVASSAWVADPSQANVILSEASLRAK